jgi:hypothetical protein
LTVALILLVAFVCLASKALASDMNQEEESEKENGGLARGRTTERESECKRECRCIGLRTAFTRPLKQ